MRSSGEDSVAFGGSEVGRVLYRATVACCRFALHEARMRGRLRNLGALAAAGCATVEDRVSMQVAWLATRVLQPSVTDLLPASLVHAQRAHLPTCVCEPEPPVGQTMSLA